MDANAYLERIGLSGRPIEPTLANLERLQRAHLTAVPFENLHVYAGRGVRTDDVWTVGKVVDSRRGGWCFELNGAFAWLLTELGYVVKRMAATVLYGNPSPMPTHLTLVVDLDRPFLVDVGFGDSFIRPLPLDSEGPHDGGIGEFGFVFEAESTTLVSYETEGPKRHYRFETDRLLPTDFEDASMYLQTQPGLQWTQSRFATRLLDGGPDRVTLLEDVLKFRHDGTWIEEPVAGRDWARLLEQWFELTP